MIKTFRERIRESVQEINKEFNSNFTINELERRLGTSVTPYVVKHTLSELKMEELEHVSGGVNVYNPRLITSAILALAMATGCVSTSSLSSNTKNIQTSSQKNSINNLNNKKVTDTSNLDRSLVEDLEENKEDFKSDINSQLDSTFKEEEDHKVISTSEEEGKNFLEMIKEKQGTLRKTQLEEKKSYPEALSPTFSRISQQIDNLSHLLPKEEAESLESSFIDEPEATSTLNTKPIANITSSGNNTLLVKKEYNKTEKRDLTPEEKKKIEKEQQEAAKELTKRLSKMRELNSSLIDQKDDDFWSK